MLPLLPKSTNTNLLSGSVDVQEQIQNCERAFERMDQDGSNAVSEAEFEDFFGGAKRGAKHGSPGKAGGGRSPRRARSIHVAPPPAKGGAPPAASAGPADGDPA